MSAIEQINQLVLAQIEYPNEQLETLDEAKTVAFGALHEAALKFEALDGPIGKAESLITLARVFGSVTLDAEQTAQVQTAVADIFGAPTPEQQAAGVHIFNTSLAAIAATRAHNNYVAGLLTPPSDEG